MKLRFQKVSDVLFSLMKEYGLGAKADEYRIMKIWDGAVGDNISSHSQPLRLIRGVLTVIVDSPAWMQQLSFYKEDLKEKINKGVGRNAITDIRFKSGKVEKKEKSGARSSIKKTPLSPLQSKKIEGFLEPIKDDKTREAIRRTITKALIRGEGKD